MGFLHPPPGDSPVIVVKDVGGDVHEYAAQARAYIASGREVRLHECRSACTLALALPNVCVYPNSVLRFHKAYNPYTKAVNDGVSDAMMQAYPPSVRQRLGVLTRQYQSLTGAELIRLGVRDCNGGPKIMVARANVGSPAANPFSNAFGSMFSGVAAGEIPSFSGYNAPVRVEKVRVQLAENAPPQAPVAAAAPPKLASPTPASPTPAPAMPAPAMPAGPKMLERAPEPAESAAPLPPQRPRDLVAAIDPPATASPVSSPASSPVLAPAAPVPTPPGRPRIIAPTAHWGAPIPGAAPALASTGFKPFVYRFVLKS